MTVHHPFAARPLSRKGAAPAASHFLRESGQHEGNALATFALALLALTALEFGCSSQHPSSQSLVQSPVYAVPAQQLAADVRQIVSAPPISLPVEDKGNGSLLTGWQEPFQGDFHIVRYWHERTRYTIDVVPDFADPAHRSRLQISDQSEQRSDEAGPNADAKAWHPAPNSHRPERAESLLKQIEAKLQAPAATRPAQ